MIPYTHVDERDTILHYANLLNNTTAKEIIERDTISNKKEAIHLALFFWGMVRKSNGEDKKTNKSSNTY